MFARIRKHLTYANVMATIAVFGVLAGGGAYAASKFKLKNNSVTSQKIVNGQVKKEDLAGGAVDSSKVADASLTGSDLAPGTVGPSSIAPAAQGARAYGYMSASGSLTRSKGVSAAFYTASPHKGIYCIQPQGFSASSAGLVATPDYTNDDTVVESTPPITSLNYDRIAHVEWRSAAPFCPSGYLEADSYRVDTYPNTLSFADSGGDTVAAPVMNVHHEPEGFFFVIP